MHMDIFRFVGNVGVEVVTKTRCRVGTVPAIAAVALLVSTTHTHRCNLNGQASIEVVMIAHD